MPKFTLFLTGLKGCGKTTLAKQLAHEGWHVLDGLCPAKARLREHLEGLPISATEVASIMDETNPENFKQTRLVLGGISPEMWIFQHMKRLDVRSMNYQTMSAVRNRPWNERVVVDGCYLARNLDLIRNSLRHDRSYLQGAIVRVTRPARARQHLDTDVTILPAPAHSDIHVMNMEDSPVRMIRALQSQLPQGILSVTAGLS